MRHIRFWSTFILCLLIGLPLLGGTVLMIAAHSHWGRTFIANTAATLSKQHLIVTGLDGALFSRLTIQHLVWQDSHGTWDIDNLLLDWNPLQLLDKVADINHLHAQFIRFSPAANKAFQAIAAPAALPLAINLHDLHIEKLDLSALADQSVLLGIDGHATFTSLSQSDIELFVRQWHNNGSYRLNSHFENDDVHARLTVTEPAQGLLAILMGLSDSKPLELTATVDGPLTALRTNGNLSWGKLNAHLQGHLNAKTQQTDWQIAATAPAMQAHAGLAWQSLNLFGTVQGQFGKPSIHSNFDIKGLQLTRTGIGHLNVSVQGTTGHLELTGEMNQLTQAGSPTDFLHAQTVDLQASLRLDHAGYPLTFNIRHPLFGITGNALMTGPFSAQLKVELPDLQPWAALADVGLTGRSALTVTARQQNQAVAITLDGLLAVTGGDPMLAKLLGKQADVSGAMSISLDEFILSRWQINGKAINLQADGTLNSQRTNANWQIGMADLAAIAPDTRGKLLAKGQINGPLDDFSVLAEVTGELATHTFPRQPVSAKLTIAHLPKRALGQVTANTVLAGSPLQLAANIKPQTDQTLAFTIDRADWKSLHAQGAMQLPKQHFWPTGSLAISVNRLEDLRSFIAHPLSGAVNATLTTRQQGQQASAYLTADARHIAWTTSATEALTAAQTQIAITLRDPLDKPRLSGRLNMTGLAIGKMTGASQLDFSGTPAQLDLQWSATLNDAADGPLDINGNAHYSKNPSLLAVTGLQAVWKQQTVRLLAPTTISLGDTLAVKDLRVGLGNAVLQADGQISPNLALTAHLQPVSLALLKVINPELNASGTVSADAKLHGSLAHAIGSIVLNGTDWRWLSPNGQALPPAQLHASAELDGSHANIQAALKAGDNATLNVSGLMPLTAEGLLDLRATGLIELKLFDPLLTASGRRVRGQIAINGGLGGTLAVPQITGTAKLGKVEWRDYAIGANLTAINGLISAKGGQLVIEKLQGEAGGGTLAVNGTVEVFKAGLPVNLSLTARNAKPLASDRLTANLNADLTVRGLAAEKVLVMGAIKINRADIRIPEYLPANIAVLKMQTPANQAPPPPSSHSDIQLNVVIAAYDEVFVRGRGVDAELDGTVHVRGTLGKPQADGGFKLRRGQYMLGGKTLTFAQGKVGFDGGQLTNPSLYLVANSSSGNATATLTIAGTANQPKITLSSVPDLPQDEILARLLFNRSSTNLSVLELLQIGSAVASLSGATSGMGDPLDSVRKTLGLDRLTVGGKKTSVEAGSYVVPGVYLGTRQGLSGGPQATIQIDVTKHIKLEAAVGANSASNKNANPNSLGVIYQFEY